MCSNERYETKFFKNLFLTFKSRNHCCGFQNKTIKNPHIVEAHKNCAI